MVFFRFRNTMRRELLKRTVKLIRIVGHIIVLPREKGISQTTPTGFRVAFKVAHFCTLLGKYEISEMLAMSVCVEFQAVKFSQGEKTTDVREHEKDVREIKIHLAQALRLIDPFDFVPALTSHRGFISQTFEPLGRREPRRNVFRNRRSC